MEKQFFDHLRARKSMNLCFSCDNIFECQNHISMAEIQAGVSKETDLKSRMFKSACKGPKYYSRMLVGCGQL